MNPESNAPIDRATPLRPRAFLECLFEPIDIASLAVFRAMFGAAMLLDVYLNFSEGWIDRIYIRPSFHTKYPFFGWVHPPPGQGMYLLFTIMGVLAAMIAAGLFYRAAMGLFWLAFTYVFLLDSLTYQNHNYLISLLGFLMIFLPAHRALSLDALWRPALRATEIPAWPVWLLRFQIGIVYIFGAVTKLEPDWLRTLPISAWLSAPHPLTHLAVDVPANRFTILLFTYGGLAIDLFAVPLLLSRRFRALGISLLALFHLANSELFPIGVFPWLMLAANLIFLDTSWPRISKVWPRSPGAATPLVPPPRSQRKVILGLLGVYAVIQIVLPLRHFAYSGVTSWTERGDRLAWRMMVTCKESRLLRFSVTDPASGQTWQAPLNQILTRFQRLSVGTHPEAIIQTAHEIARREGARVGREVEVRVESRVALNGRPPRLLIDPEANLVRERSWPVRPDLILPMDGDNPGSRD